MSETDVKKDIRASLEEAEQDRIARTDKAAEQIRELADDTLECAAGGGRHGEGERNPACKYSYKDKENCYFKDACDNTWPYYPEYLCKKHNLGT
ncbi:MAG: hypothetical protein IKD85_03320 [Firmicutes bacterium]|nr:hypothetical protein [Bacillota bacterium]